MCRPEHHFSSFGDGCRHDKSERLPNGEPAFFGVRRQREFDFGAHFDGAT